MTVGNAAAGGGAAAAIGVGAGAPPSAAIPALAQTGASIEELVAVGVAAIVVGLTATLLMRRRSRRLWAEADAMWGAE